MVGGEGAYIYVRKCLEIREVNYFQNMNEENKFEMAVIELLRYKIIVVCMYRAPDGNFKEFLSNLELMNESKTGNPVWRLEYEFSPGECKVK
jgi:hypothetical protein